MLDHGLRMHLRLGIRRELLHRRRAALPVGVGAQLGEDLLVRVALADRASGTTRARPGRSRRSPRSAAFSAMQQMVDHVAETASRRRVRAAVATLRRCCSSSRSPPRARSARSRASPAAAAARRSRASFSRRVDPGAVDRLAAAARARLGARLGHERQDDDDRDGRRDPRPRQARLQPLRREPALGRRLHPPRSRGAELGLFEVDEAALPEIARRVRRGSSRSATSSATSSTATASSSTSPSAGARRSPRCPTRALVVNADDPLLGELARGRASDGHATGSTTRATPARRSSTRPTRSTAVPAARPTSTPPPTSGTSATTAARTGTRARAPLDVAAREIELHGPRRRGLPPRHAGGLRAGRARAARASTTSTTRPLRRPRSRRARRAARRDRGRARALRRRLRPVRADRRSATSGC